MTGHISALLWPYLFEYVCQESYAPCVATVCKALLTLTQRTIEEGNQITLNPDEENRSLVGILSKTVLVMPTVAIAYCSTCIL